MIGLSWMMEREEEYLKLVESYLIYLPQCVVLTCSQQVNVVASEL